MKYYLWILGCAMNYSDAERIASVFDLSGYTLTKSEAEADIVVVVACSVRQKAIDRIYGKTKAWNKRRAKNPGFKTILSGCVLSGDKKKLAKSFDLIFEINQIDQLEVFLNSELVLDIERVKDYLSMVPKYESSFRAYVPIMTGCDNFCSYCAVPYTRGREVSRPAKEIVAEVRALVANGYKEITLLGQNVNSYDCEALQRTDLCNHEGPSFVGLLKKIDKIPGDYRVYFYSNHPKDFSEALIKALPTLRHFPAYIHLPLQSGNDKILKKMNRHYAAQEYLALVKKIRGNMPEVVLTTDVIVGFPGEGEKEFTDTVEVVKKAKFEMIFIGQYSPRPGTLSARMVDDVPKETKKERERILTDLLRENLEKQNRKFVGQTMKVLVDEVKSGKYYGRTEGYKVAELDFSHPELAEGSNKERPGLEVGSFCEVEITGSRPWKLSGKTISLG